MQYCASTIDRIVSGFDETRIGYLDLEQLGESTIKNDRALLNEAMRATVYALRTPNQRVPMAERTLIIAFDVPVVRDAVLRRWPMLQHSATVRQSAQLCDLIKHTTDCS